MAAVQVKRLPKHQGPAGWSSILPNQAAPVVLEHNCTADFVVVGAGFTGLSAAERLRQLNPAARIVVLEAGRLAEGAAGRNSGFMIDLPHDLASDDYVDSDQEKGNNLIRHNRKAIAFAREAVEHFGIPEGYFAPIGKTNGAASETGEHLNDSYAEHLTSIGEKWEMLDAKSMYEMTGSRHYRSGLYTPGTVLIQPAGYIRGLGEGLRNHIHIYENSPVISTERVDGDWLLTTSKGKITTPKVILANNGHLESFGYKKQRLMHIFLYASMTKELDEDALSQLGGVDHWGVTPSDPMGTTMRRISLLQGGNRIVARTTAFFRPNMETSSGDARKAEAVIKQKFADRFPQLAQVPMEHTWAGHLCLSRNAVTVLGELEPGVFAACCQNGLGTVRGTMTGMAIAEVASGYPSEIAAHFADEPEPTKLPFPPVSTLGANLYLKTKEWLAGDE